MRHYLKFNKPTLITTELGHEKLCSRCKEYWPADTEFFLSNRTKKDGLDNYCKACKAEISRERYQRQKTLSYA